MNWILWMIFNSVETVCSTSGGMLLLRFRWMMQLSRKVKISHSEWESFSGEGKKDERTNQAGKINVMMMFLFWDDGCEKENYYQWQLNYRALFAFLIALRLNNFCLFVFCLLVYVFASSSTALYLGVVGWSSDRLKRFIGCKGLLFWKRKEYKLWLGRGYNLFSMEYTLS